MGRSDRMRRSDIGVALILALTATRLLAANPPAPYLIKDLNPTTTTQTSDPISFTGLAAGNVVFVLTEGALPALWCTDGTDAGTYPVYDETIHYDRGALMAASRAQSSVFFGFNNPAGRLYTTDGTTPGTHFVKDVRFYEGAPCGDGRFCFAGGKNEIGVSDGTAEGTSILLATASGAQPPWLYGMTTFGNRVFFNAFDDRYADCFGACGELWMSDGTAAGTHLFKDLNPGPYPSAPLQFFASSTQKLFFRAENPGTSGFCVVWGSDGTPEGTRPLRTDRGFTCANFPTFVEAGKRVYYVDAFGEVMRSEGTPETTATVWPVQTDDSRKARSLATINDVVLIETVGGLWATTGSDPVPLVSGDVTMLGKIAATGRAYFAIGDQLWSTDGTPQGTQPLFTLPPFGGTISPYAATSSTFFYISGEREIFVSDGTQTGTRRVRFETTSGASSTPHDFLRFGDRVLFTTESPRRHNVTDGTAAGTTSFADAANSFTNSMFVREGHVYFIDEADRLWTTDGTAAGTKTLNDWLGVSDVVEPPTFLGQTAIFATRQNDLSFTLMRRDGNGTPASLALQHQWLLSDFASVGNRVLFQSSESGALATLYVTDGTDDGTKALASHSQLEGTPMAFGAGALFASWAKESGLSLWTTDFTANGTRALKSISMQSYDRFIPLFVRQGIAFFAVGDPALFRWSGWGGKVWRTDGTPAGTFALSDQTFVYAAWDAGGVTLIRNAPAATAAWEVWSSDGTAAGTHIRYSGGGTIMSEPFTLPSGELAFAHMNGSNALDVRTIATNQATTIPLGDLTIGPVLYANGRLHFGASRGTIGAEPWAISLTGDAPPADAAGSVSVTYRGTAATIDGRAAIFTVTMSTNGAAHPTVVASTADGTLAAPADYVAFTKNIVFDGDHDVTLVVPLRTDHPGTLHVVLSSPVNATIVQGMATALITESGKHRAVRR